MRLYAGNLHDYNIEEGVHRGRQTGQSRGGKGIRMEKPFGDRVRMRAPDEGRSAEHRQAYFSYQLAAWRRYLYRACLVIGLFNEALLIPDLLLVKGIGSRLLIVALRTLFTVLLVTFSLFSSRVRAGRSYYRLVTAGELFAVAIFLFVLLQYEKPNFMIQAAGLYVIILVVFLFPNRYRNMFAVSFLGIAGFLSLSCFVVGGVGINELAAGVVYFAATLYICSIYAIARDRQQYREFLSKTQLMQMSYTDQLTKASSRNRLFSEFARWQKSCRRRQKPLSLALFDIDHFKSVNDRFGHVLADGVLVELVRLTRIHLRNTDLLVRWGGDEFVILFPETAPEDAGKVLERIRRAVGRHLFAQRIPITCSFGIAGMEGESTLDSMIQKADDLMYQGKKLGGDRVESKQRREEEG